MRTDDVAPKLQKSGVSRKKAMPENVTEAENADVKETVKQRNLSKVPENEPIKQTEESNEMTDDPKNSKSERWTEERIKNESKMSWMFPESE